MNPRSSPGITGVVQPLPGSTVCAGGTHMLECTKVVLASNTVDLTLYEGQLVKLLGNQTGVGSVAMCHGVNVTVPSTPNIVGLEIWLQGARRDVGPVGPVSLTNAICLTVTPPLPPCAPINC